MRRVLVLFEKDRAGRTPEVAIRFARGAEAGGVDARLRSLDVAGIDDVKWAQALALALAPARGRDMPWAVKRWMDALGFVGWASFAGKSGCIFASDHRTSGCDRHTHELVARLLVCRGMSLCAVDANGNRPVFDGDHSDDSRDALAQRAADRGFRLARRMMRYRLGHERRPAASGPDARLRAAALALIESGPVSESEETATAATAVAANEDRTAPAASAPVRAIG